MGKIEPSKEMLLQEIRELRMRLASVESAGATVSANNVMPENDARELNQDQYRCLYDRIRDAILVTDAERRILHCNAAFTSLFGYELEEILGKTTQILFPNDLEYERIGDALKTYGGEGRLLVHVCHKSKNGDEFSTESNIIAFKGADGEISTCVAVIRDVSKYEQAKKELNLAHAREQHVLESISDAFFSLDNKLVITHFNPAAEKALGRKQAEVIGQYLFDAFPEAKGSIFETAYRNALANQQSHSFETFFGVSPYDNWYEVRVYPYQEGLAVYFQIVTEQKQAEMVIARERDLLRALMDNIPDTIYFKDRECRFIRINQAQAELLGITTPEAATGKTDFDFFPKEHAELAFQDDRQVLDLGEPVIGRVEHIQRRDGWRWMSATKVPIRDKEGVITGLVGISHDITNRKNAEEQRIGLERQIQQTQRLESLGVLAGGIAHDFNNLLMAVLGHAELALSEVSPMSAARDSIRQIETATCRAAELCRQMLAYAGKASFALEQIDLHTLIEEMMHLLKTSISKKAILNLHIEHGLPMIKADPTQIRQIIMNLIVNASEAIGERSGVISISAGAAWCDRDYLKETYLENDLSEGLYVYLEIADTGCGMEAEVRARIFEPFYTTKFAGRGLGMAAVMGIVQSHSGAMKVYSEPGKGTTFKILFPALNMDMEEVANASAGKEFQWRGEGNVLLVDDEETLRAIGRKTLEKLGFSVMTAADGCEAVAIYKEHGAEIDLILLDLTMPHMDGTEAFRELRRINPEVRIVLVSGYSEQDVAARFAGKGPNGVMQKPYRLARLKEVLQEALPKST